MEYVKVEFPEDRVVYIDNEATARTNQIFRVTRGRHTFRLEQPNDYTPDKVDENVLDTSMSNPALIVFSKLL